MGWVKLQSFLFFEFCVLFFYARTQESVLDLPIAILQQTTTSNGIFNNSFCPADNNLNYEASESRLLVCKSKSNSTTGNQTCLIPSENYCDLASRYICDVTPCELGCQQYFMDPISFNCYHRDTICDGSLSNTGSPLKYEWFGFKCIRKGKLCILPQFLVLDDVADCDDNRDLCFFNNKEEDEIDFGRDSTSPTGLNKDNCAYCLDGSLIGSVSMCDGWINCPDLSDECLCQTRPEICDHVQFGFGLSAIDGVSCRSGQIKCDGKCLDFSSICDGKVDCTSQLDESSQICDGSIPCNESVTLGEKCTCDGSVSFQDTKYCDGFNNCPSKYITSSEECTPQCLNHRNISFNNSGCSLEISVFFQLDLESSILQQKDVTESQICSLVPITHGVTCCDGIVEASFSNYSSYLGDDEHNNLCISLGRHFCNNSFNPDVVSIPSDYLCDTYIDCIDTSDELNCTDGRFYCKSGRPLFIPKYKVFDGNLDCLDYSDECSFTNSFSSAYELIDNPILRTGVWLMAIFATVGNMVVIVGQCKILAIQKHASCLLKVNHALVLNLAVADLLMGVYLLLLASHNHIYSGHYCLHDVGWRTGLTCNAMGCIVVISGQTSVFTMILLTSVRLYSIIKPFSTRRLSNRIILVFILLTWLTSILIAFFPFIPTFESKFYSQGMVNSDNPYFLENFVSFDDYRIFLQKAAELRNLSTPLKNHKILIQLSNAFTWNQLTELACDIFDDCNDLLIKHTFGYYSLNSVCLPNLFVSNSTEIWKFSFLIILFNFVGFLYVMFSYIAIHFLVRKSNKSALGKHGKNRKTQNSEIQNKIMRLIATDFCCWMPICILAILRRFNVIIDDWVYDVIAIIVYPINSTLNPILYSNILDRIFAKVKEKVQFRSENTIEVSI